MRIRKWFVQGVVVSGGMWIGTTAMAQVVDLSHQWYGPTPDPKNLRDVSLQERQTDPSPTFPFNPTQPVAQLIIPGCEPHSPGTDKPFVPIPLISAQTINVQFIEPPEGLLPHVYTPEHQDREQDPSPWPASPDPA